ncbi:TM2 domain-containing protein [Corynebacterium sp. AOP34-AQ2-28]|uniref:TM2 domain-containing protein n=1 Tax=Corynebacterium sp. AOP34-AQ2-28 TaxID=3457689 RepID=UPI0040337CE8
MTDSSKPSDNPFPDSSDNSDAPQVPETPETPETPEAPKGRWSGMETPETPESSADQQTQAYGQGYGQGYGQSYAQGYNQSYGQEQSVPGYPGYPGSGDSQAAHSAQPTQAAPGVQPYPGGPTQPGAYPAGASYPGGYPGQAGYASPPASRKSKVAAALFAFFLGGFGAHNFYIGNKGRAIAQLVILLVSWVIMIGGYGLIVASSETYTTMTGSVYYDNDETLLGAGVLLILLSSAMMFALWVWTMVEFVLILVGSGRYARDAEGYQLS